VLEASVRLAETLQTLREVWLGKAALGKVLAGWAKTRRPKRNHTGCESDRGNRRETKTSRLRRSFLGAEPVLEVYRLLGRRPPLITGD